MSNLKISKYKGFQLILILSITIYACKFSSNSEAEKNFYNISIENFKNSNKQLSYSTMDSYSKLEELLRKPLTAYHAKPYEIKAKSIMETSQKIYDSLEILKTNKITDGEKFKETIYKLLFDYTKNLMNLELERAEYSKMSFNKFLMGDSLKYRAFINEIKFNEEKIKEFSLCKIQNDIRSIENYYVSFCNSFGSPGCNLPIYMTSLLVGQSTTHLRKGEILEITAGIGEYVQNMLLSARINNENLKQERLGIVNYKYKVSGKTGKNSIPLILKYKDTRGKEKIDTIIIDYTIDD